MSLNRGSSMTLSSKGSKLRTRAHRLRMPWTRAREVVPVCVLSRKDKAILDGVPLVEGIHRTAQLEPLIALKAIAAQRDYVTSTGLNLFQLAAHLLYQGRGQRFYRRDWKEGTYDKHITLSSIVFAREGFTGEAFGYVTFHGESTVAPVAITHADVPGWCVDAVEENAVPPDALVSPPPSIGTDIPVDPTQYKLKAYPFYDPPNPSEFVEKLMKERGLIPDPPVGQKSPLDGRNEESTEDGSYLYQKTVT